MGHRSRRGSADEPDEIGLRERKKRATRLALSRATVRLSLDRSLDVVHEPDVAPGTWTYAAGTIHHCAFAVDGEAEQDAIRDDLNPLGYIDVSEIKDRFYFRSIYVRTPGGALFEFATNGPRFTIDEPAGEIGRKLLLPTWLQDRADEVIADLEPISVPSVPAERAATWNRVQAR